MEQDLTLKSRYKLSKEETDKNVFDRYLQLMEVEGAQILEVYKQIKAEFPEINSDSTIWAIRKREVARRKQSSVKR